MSDLVALAICGPTASGKSAAAARAALAFGGEIINADSRQVYEGMRVGTGWPDSAVMALAPHHGYGFVSPADRYSAGRFVIDATRMISDVAARGKIPMLVGGTGLYIEALAGTMPLDRAVADDEVRARVLAEAAVHPQDALFAWLSALAPNDVARVPRRDRYRTMRALEAALAKRAGTSASERAAARVRLVVVVLGVPQSLLRERIRQRTEAMFAGGLIDEAVDVRRRFGAAPALTGLGYAEALAITDGLASRQEAERATTQRTISYAKRQETWFRRMRDTRVIDATDTAAVVDAIGAAARELTRSA